MMDRDEFERLISQIERAPGPGSQLHALAAAGGISRADGSHPLPPALSARSVEEASVQDDQAAGNQYAIVDRDETPGDR